MRNGQLLLGNNEEAMFNQMDEIDVSRNRSRNIIPRFFKALQKRPDDLDPETEEVTQANGYREVEYVEFLIPGDKNAAPVQLVDKNVRKQFSQAYQAWKEGSEMPSDGTPIEFLFGANDARVHVLKSLHIRTAEALADLSDSALAQVGMGAREMRKRAKAYLESQGGVKIAEKLAAKDSMIEDLMKRLAKLEAGGPTSEIVRESEDEDELRVEGLEDEDDGPTTLRPAGASPVSDDKRPRGAKPDRKPKVTAKKRRA